MKLRTTADQLNMDLIRKFTCESPLHGPAFAFGSDRTKRDVICWVPLILFCTVMTVYQIVTLVQLYQTVPTAVSIAWVKNEPLQLDNLILSVPHFFLDDDLAIFDILAKNETDMANELSQINVTKLQQNVNGGVKPDLSDTLVVHMMRMFAKMAAGEKLGTKAAANQARVKLDSVLAQLEEAKDPYPYRWEPRDLQVHNFLVQNQIPFIPLLKTVMATVCDRMRIRIRNSSIDYLSVALQLAKEKDSNFWVSLYSYDFPDIISCDPSMIVYFDESKFALQLHSPANPLVFKSAGDVFQIRFYPASTDFDINVDTNGEICFVHLDNKVYFDDKLMDRGNQIGVRQMYISSSAIRVRTSFQFYNTQRSPCTETQNQYDCIHECFGHRFAANCHCWPLHKFLWKPPNIPICSETLTSTPPNNLSTPYVSDCPPMNDNDRNICVGECPADCNSVDYESVPVGNSDRTVFFEEQQDICEFAELNCQGQQESFTSIQLKAGMFSYQFIQESPVKDWQTFLNELGGLIGVWLGGSLIAFVHIPIFLLNYCKSAYQSKKKAKIGGGVGVALAQQTAKSPAYYMSNGAAPFDLQTVPPV